MASQSSRKDQQNRADAPLVLTLNGGSSSLKFSISEATAPPRRVLRGAIASIGAEPALTLDSGDGCPRREMVRAADHAQALEAALEHLGGEGTLARLSVVGHRIVHGGPHGDRTRRITPALLEELRELASLDPDHLPAELAIVQAMSARLPRVEQVACFDTAFHRELPAVARLVPIPRKYAALGVRRYGFHGLSFTFVLEELARVAGESSARGRVVLAHLGAGASLAAVSGGQCVETTMGFTPTSGLVMATRTGDLDPGVLLWLLRQERLSLDELDDLLNHRSGLLGVSGTSGDMQVLLAAEPHDPHAAEAVGLFCHQAKKAIGAMAATLGGLDTLLFTGGIGENSARIRHEICEGLAHLGVSLEPELNERNASIVSNDDAACVVRVIPTDEESVVVREALRYLDEHPMPNEAGTSR